MGKSTDGDMNIGRRILPATSATWSIRMDAHGTPFPTRPRNKESYVMGSLLHWAIVFLIVALVAALLGFGGVAGTAMAGAKILFWVAIVIFVIALVAGLLRRGR